MVKRVGLSALLALGLGLWALPVAQAGEITVTTYDGDATSGISSSKTYTHAIDLAGPGETINGVTFAAGGTGDRRTQYQYDLEGARLSGTSSADNVSGNSNTLERNYFYDTIGNNPNGRETLTLTGLTVGYTYTTTFYDIGNGPAGGRYTDITDGDRTRFVYDENYAGNGNGNLIRDTFTATRTEYTYMFDVDTTNSNPGDPNLGTRSLFYQYGFTNEVVATPEPSTLTLLVLGAGCWVGGAWRRRKKVAGAICSPID